jgi:hypothetical protein
MIQQHVKERDGKTDRLRNERKGRRKEAERSRSKQKEKEKRMENTERGRVR